MIASHTDLHNLEMNAVVIFTLLVTTAAEALYSYFAQQPQIGYHYRPPEFRYNYPQEVPGFIRQQPHPQPWTLQPQPQLQLPPKLQLYPYSQPQNLVPRPQPLSGYNYPQTQTRPIYFQSHQELQPQLFPQSQPQPNIQLGQQPQPGYNYPQPQPKPDSGYPDIDVRSPALQSTPAPQITSTSQPLMSSQPQPTAQPLSLSSSLSTSEAPQPTPSVVIIPQPKSTQRPEQTDLSDRSQPSSTNGPLTSPQPTPGGVTIPQPQISVRQQSALEPIPSYGPPPAEIQPISQPQSTLRPESTSQPLLDPLSSPVPITQIDPLPEAVPLPLVIPSPETALEPKLSIGPLQQQPQLQPQSSHLYEGPQPLPLMVSQPQPAPQIQYSKQEKYTSQHSQQTQYNSQFSLQPVQLPNSQVSSYQADSNQYLLPGRIYNEGLDEEVVSRVQNALRDNEQSLAQKAGYQSSVSGVSLGNIQPSLEILSFVQNSRASRVRNIPSSLQGSISSSSSYQDFSSKSRSESIVSSNTFGLLPRSPLSTFYGVPSY